MNQNLEISLNRADELLRELKSEYQNSLNNQQVSGRAVQLTHDVCEKLRNVLDRVARRYWEQHISPHLTETDQKAATVYFPIVSTPAAFDSSLGRWKWRSIRHEHQQIYDYLLSLQPFTDPARKWLDIVNDLAVQGKHIDLVPQKRFENRQVTVSRPGGGSVSWSGNVSFSGNVSVMGAPIDVRTQRIVPTPGVIERVEIWVSFVISGHDVNALGFCEEACRQTRIIAEEMSRLFGLA